MTNQDESRKRFLLEWLEASRAPSTTGAETGEPQEVGEVNESHQVAVTRKSKPIGPGSSRRRKPGRPTV
jgi:hypothetical protein